MSDDHVKLGDFGLSKDMGTSSFTDTYVGVRCLPCSAQKPTADTSDTVIHASGDIGREQVRHEIGYLELGLSGFRDVYLFVSPRLYELPRDPTHDEIAFCFGHYPTRAHHLGQVWQNPCASPSVLSRLEPGHQSDAQPECLFNSLSYLACTYVTSQQNDLQRKICSRWTR
jgi:hypothetical protein